MQSYRDTVAILAAAATHPDLELRQLLCERIESLADDLPCLLYVLVLEHGDTVADLETQIGSRFPLVPTLPRGNAQWWPCKHSHAGAWEREIKFKPNHPLAPVP